MTCVLASALSRGGKALTAVTVCLNYTGGNAEAVKDSTWLGCGNTAQGFKAGDAGGATSGNV